MPGTVRWGNSMELANSRTKAVEWLARSVDEAGSGQDPSRIMQDVCRTAGARHAALVMQHVPGVVTENSFAIETFGQAWRDHCDAEKYEAIDPSRMGVSLQEPVIDWADAPRDKLKARRFFRDAQDFHVGRQGITFLHRGHLGDRSLLTLTSDCTDRRWITIKAELTAAAAVLHPALHRFVLRTRFNINGSVAVRLTPREKECLGWAAHGRTSKEIGDVLGLTPATVNFFIEAAVQKLAAFNRAHAAAKAVALGLISPPR
jgi:LuxR family transcriptional regulator, activator of conjugal transfer of Ti plasmids